MRLYQEWTDIEITHSEREDITPNKAGLVLAVANLADRSELSNSLVEQGFNVWPVDCGLDALAACVEHAGSVNLLLIDADLRDLPGYSFLRRFRNYFPTVHCVFRTDDLVIASGLRSAGAFVVSMALPPVVVAVRLWGILSLGNWINT